MVTGTTGPTKCMFTVMRTTTIVLFAAIDNFQFNPFPNKQKRVISITTEKPECMSTIGTLVEKTTNFIGILSILYTHKSLRLLRIANVYTIPKY